MVTFLVLLGLRQHLFWENSLYGCGTCGSHIGTSKCRPLLFQGNLIYDSSSTCLTASVSESEVSSDLKKLALCLWEWLFHCCGFQAWSCHVWGNQLYSNSTGEHNVGDWECSSLCSKGICFTVATMLPLWGLKLCLWWANLLDSNCTRSFHIGEQGQKFK